MSVAALAFALVSLTHTHPIASTIFIVGAIAIKSISSVLMWAYEKTPEKHRATVDVLALLVLLEIVGFVLPAEFVANLKHKVSQMKA